MKLLKAMFEAADTKYREHCRNWSPFIDDEQWQKTALILQMRVRDTSELYYDYLREKSRGKFK